MRVSPEEETLERRTVSDTVTVSITSEKKKKKQKKKKKTKKKGSLADP